METDNKEITATKINKKNHFIFLKHNYKQIESGVCFKQSTVIYFNEK